MKNWKIYILIVLCVLLQISLIPNLKIFNFFPNFVLIFLLISLIIQKDYQAIWWVVLGGLLLDTFSPQFFGYYSLQFLTVFLTYRLLVRPFLHDPAYFMITVIFIFYSLLITLIDGFITRQDVTSILPVVIIYQPLCGLICYGIVSRFRKRYEFIKA